MDKGGHFMMKCTSTFCSYQKASHSCPISL